MRKLTLSLLVPIVTVFALTTQAQNLIVNPNFSYGWTGWNGTWGIYGGPYTYAGLPMNPPPQFGILAGVLDGGEPAMYQSFPTEPGITYQVTWDRRLPELDGTTPVEGWSDPNPAILNVNLNGQLIQDFIQNRTFWQTYTVDFVATGTSTELSFDVPQYLIIPGVGIEHCDSVFIDYVSAMAVPEPSVWAILLPGFAYIVRRKARDQEHIAFL